MINDWKKHITFTTKNLHLDIKNPRTDTGGKISENDVIKELLKEDVLSLAKDIAEGGFLAASTLMVAKDNEKQVTIDGNRRLLAVQILQNPKIVNNLISKNSYEELLSFSKNIDENLSKLSGVLYPSRKEAEKEMAKMHLAGIAVKQWRLIRQCRYFQKRLDEEKDLSIETLAELLGIDKSRLKKNVKTYQLYKISKSKFPGLTNSEKQSIYNDDIFLTDKFQRLIVHEEGERFLGYVFSDKNQKIEIKNEKKFFQNLEFSLKKLYDNSLPAQFNTQDRLNVFKEKESQFLNTKEYKKQLKIQEKIEKSGQKPMFSLGENNTNNEIEKEVEKNERSDQNPKGLFSSSKVPYKLGNKQLQKLYNELKTPSILKFPNATHDLFRSFLECSLVAYLKHSNINKYNDVLKKKKKNQKNLNLTDILSYLGKDNDSPIKDKSTRDIAWQLITDDHAVYSVERMNLVNHNENWFSEEDDVRKTWDKTEPLFKIILNPKKDEK
jgi:hypothetical protein